MKTNIYALCELTGEIRYIGKTIQLLNRRFAMHLSEARNHTRNYRHCWIRSLLTKGCSPTIMLIGMVEGTGVCEEMAWIAYGKAEGWRLVNGTDGGEGLLNPSAETRRKIGIGKKNKIVSLETRKRISEQIKKYLAIHPHNEKQINALKKGQQKGRIISEETKNKFRLARKKYVVSEETRKKMSNYHKSHPISFWKGKSFSLEHRTDIGSGVKNYHICKHIAECAT